MMEELQLRNCSAATTDSYLRAVWRFTKHCGKSPDLLGPEDVRQYLLHLLGKKRATNTLQVNRAALRFLYVRVLKRGWFDEIPALPVLLGYSVELEFLCFVKRIQSSRSAAALVSQLVLAGVADGRTHR